MTPEGWTQQLLGDRTADGQALADMLDRAGRSGLAPEAPEWAELIADVRRAGRSDPARVALSGHLGADGELIARQLALVIAGYLRQRYPLGSPPRPRSRRPVAVPPPRGGGP